jgi:hypothetical protein
MAQGEIALFRRLFAGQGDDRAYLLGCYSCRRPWTGRVRQALSQQRGATFHFRGDICRAAPAAEPVTHRLWPNAELARTLAHARSRPGQQDHLGAFGQLPRRRVGSNQTGEYLFMLGAYQNGFGGQTRHRGPSRIGRSTGDPT